MDGSVPGGWSKLDPMAWLRRAVPITHPGVEQAVTVGFLSLNLPDLPPRLALARMPARFRVRRASTRGGGGHSLLHGAHPGSRQLQAPFARLCWLGTAVPLELCQLGW